MTLTDTQVWAVANGLRVAAEQYDADALANSTPPTGNDMPAEARARMVQLFTDQATAARELASMFEGAGAVKVEA